MHAFIPPGYKGKNGVVKCTQNLEFSYLFLDSSIRTAKFNICKEKTHTIKNHDGKQLERDTERATLVEIWLSSDEPVFLSREENGGRAVQGQTFSWSTFFNDNVFQPLAAKLPFIHASFMQTTFTSLGETTHTFQRPFVGSIYCLRCENNLGLYDVAGKKVFEG